MPEKKTAVIKIRSKKRKNTEKLRKCAVVKIFL